jgi:putative Mg2+ transporter-C (MgtC) family protein
MNFLFHKVWGMNMGSYIGIFNEEFLTMTARIFMAALLCGFIGIEREIKGHDAGFRTHLLVGIGSCIMMLLSLYGFQPYLNDHPNIRFDPARIPSYVISGIGFLGAGTILVKGATVKGLTTAASIWVVAGLGLITGVGMFAPAILTTIVVLLSLIFLNQFEAKFFQSKKKQLVQIIVEDGENTLSGIIQNLENQHIEIESISTDDIKDDEKVYNLKQYTFQVKFPNRNYKAVLYNELFKMESIRKIT